PEPPRPRPEEGARRDRRSGRHRERHHDDECPGTPAGRDRDGEADREPHPAGARPAARGPARAGGPPRHREHDLRGDPGGHGAPGGHGQEPAPSGPAGAAEARRGATGHSGVESVMTPDEARELFSAAWDDELDDAKRAAFEATLASNAPL